MSKSELVFRQVDQTIKDEAYITENRSDAAADDWPDPIPLPPAGGTEEAPPYPLSCLPDAIQTAAAEVARFVKIPQASPAVIGLSTIATAIGKKATIEERGGLTHHPALFFSLIAASGERKSPPFKKMTYPLEAWIQDRMEDYEDLRREAKATNGVIEARISGLLNKAKKEESDTGLTAIQRDITDLEARRIAEPIHPRMFTTDTTEQRLFQKMEAHGGAYAVLSGEGRPVFDAIMGKYSGENRTGDAVYLAGISGDTITRDRVGNEHGPEEKAIYHPCLNVCVMVQPDKYLEAASSRALRESGALARIWPVWLPSMVGSRIEEPDEQDLDDNKLATYHKLIYDLLNHKRPVNEDGRTIPHRVVLSAEAKQARREFHNLIEQLMGEGGDLADVRDIASKAVSQVVKLALVLHLADNSSVLTEAESQLSLKTWAAAQGIGIYHLAEATRVQRLADEDTVLDMARRILDWIRRQRFTEVTARSVSQYAPRPRPNAREAETILDLLADHHGYLRYRNDPARRKPVYEVHPSLCSHCSQSSQEVAGK